MPYSQTYRKNNTNQRSRYKKSTYRSYNNRNSQTIDSRRFVKAATAHETPVYEPQHVFAEFMIHEQIKKNLQSMGYATPSPIQDQAIPAGINGQDIVGIASTGTGKTAAFAVPLLSKLAENRNNRALIIAPTRELAEQIEVECQKISQGTGIRSVLLIGGTNISYQLRNLRNKPQLIIGTPGRIKDHIGRRSLNLESTQFVVLDEVDRMLDMGFLPDVREILSELPETRQSYFFSATMDAKIQALIDTFTTDAVKISLTPSSASENIHQDVITYKATHEKIDKLHDILLDRKVTKTIIFDETKRSVEQLAKELVSRGFAAESMHGGKSQSQRQRALKQFKKDDVTILVATDVAARGIDVVDVSHVINYSTPKVYDDYIHRIGRAGRAGKIGYALTFVNQ